MMAKSSCDIQGIKDQIIEEPSSPDDDMDYLDTTPNISSVKDES